MVPPYKFMAAFTTVVVALVSIRSNLRAKRVPKKIHGRSRPGQVPNGNIDRVAAGKTLQLC